MATKTINLYPSADISLGHSCSRGSTGYNLINSTEVSDTTYIECPLVASQTKTATSVFKVSGNTGKIILRGISVRVRAERYKSALADVNSESSYVTAGVSINGGTKVTSTNQNLTNSWKEFNISLSPSGLNNIYNSINDANIQLTLFTSGTYTTDKTPTLADRISQSYVTATYENVYDCYAYSITGTGVKTVSVSNNEVIDGNNCTFTATLENGYIFLGWYSDEACTQLVSNKTTYTSAITSNTTLYAKGGYEYFVTVYPDENCTVNSNPSSGVIGTEITVIANFEKRYKFDGWYSNSSRTTLVSKDNPYIFSLNRDVTLYAKTVLNELMYVKVNNTWIECQEVYKKIDGAWVKQDVLTGLFDTTKKYKKNEV